jgi:toxin-antitoxin system PIN domain toxin
MISLLDVNLLFVLHQQLHPEHSLVSQWFKHGAVKRFATCPITQSGMIRLLVQEIAGLDVFNRDEARAALRSFVARPGHEYWPDKPDFLDATKAISIRMQGHRQTTDAYLLGLAIHNKGKLATLDRGILHLAGKEFAAHVELIEPGATKRKRAN